MTSSRESSARVDDDVALDLKGILAAIGRRIVFVVLATFLVGGGAFFALSAMAPRYEAETKILIENREPSISRDQTAPSERATIDAETVVSQVQLLTSRDLARRVAEKNRLADKAEFDGTEGGLLETVLAAVGLGRDRMRVSPEERVVDAFIERLKVFQVDGSRVITIQFRSTDADLAAAVANSVAEEYLALQSEAKRRTSADQTRWLGEEIEKLRVKVRDADEAVEKYRNTNDLLTGSGGATIARQQITDITNSIAAARSDQAIAESKAKILADLLAGRGDLDTAADVLDSESFKTLRTRMSALQNRLSELSVTMLPGHPQVKAVESQIADIRAQEASEARRMLSAIRNDAKVAAARIQSLQDSLNQIKVTSAADGESEVELKALEREAASQRNILDGLLARYREATARQNAEVLPADARIISRAATPVEPAFPKVKPLSVVATLAGFLLAVSWVIAGEFLSGRALTRVPPNGPVEPPVERPRVETPVLASVPQPPEPPPAPEPSRKPRESVARAPDAADAPVDPRVARFRARVDAASASVAAMAEDVPAAEPAIAEEPASDVTPEPAPEPARPAGAAKPSMNVVELDELHAMLIADGATRVAVMGLGTATAVERVIDHMSRRATSEGTRVVVVDTVPSHVGIGGVGLSDLLAGEADFADIIRRNPATRAHEIGVGTDAVPSEIWGSPEIDTMLDALENTYDLVVLDLGRMGEDAARFRMVAVADHAILVGETGEADTLRVHALLVQSGVERLSVVEAPDFDVEDAVA